jgi:uncharacterized protein YndB with AHSA1/START domain
MQGQTKQEPSAIHSTFVVERSFPKPPETVFAAFADASKKRRWFAESESHDVQEFSMDFRVGGGERLRYRFKEGSPVAGMVLTNTGIFQDIVLNRRIVSASAMTLGDKRISASLVTFEFLATREGTDLICTHQGPSSKAPMALKCVKLDSGRSLRSWRRSWRAKNLIRDAQHKG